MKFVKICYNTIHGRCPHCGAPVSVGEGTAKTCPNCKKVIHGNHDGSIS